MDKKINTTCEQCGSEFDSVEKMDFDTTGCSKCSQHFTLSECIKVLDNVKSASGVEKGGSLNTKEFNSSITKITGLAHANFINMFVESLICIGCIELNENKTEVTILLDGDDLE